MGSIDIELAEYILTMRVDGMNAESALLGYLLGGKSMSYLSNYLLLGRRKLNVIPFRLALRKKQYLRHSLTNIALTIQHY